MFVAVGETHGTRNKQKRTSSNNLFLLPHRGREEKELQRLGEPRVLTRGYERSECKTKISRGDAEEVREVLKISLQSLRL